MSNAEAKTNLKPSDEQKALLKNVVSADLAATLTRYKENNEEQELRRSRKVEECRREKLGLQSSNPRDWPALLAVYAKEEALKLSGNSLNKSEFHPEHWQHRLLGAYRAKAKGVSK